MGLFSKEIKLFGKSILIIIGLLSAYLLSEFILSRIAVNSDVKSATDGIDIYLLSNGVHTDIVMPIQSDIIDWSKEVKFENTRSKDSTMQFLAVGWGDKGFYLETPEWSDLKFSVAFKAAFYLGSSAMHATFYRQITEDEKCVRIRISKEEYQKLILYIKNSFQYNNEGNIILIDAPTYGVNDAFYEAKRVYGLFYTCNTWTNNALKAADQKACFWTVFDKGIFYQYKK